MFMNTGISVWTPISNSCSCIVYRQ